MVKKPPFAAEKFKELLLYIADKSVEDRNFGATKLNKILFFSDFVAYGKYGRSITGARYQRLDQGPAPKELVPMQESLIEEGDAYLFERSHYGHIQRRLLARRDPDLRLFTGEEIAVVDEVIEALSSMTARGVSALSHDKLAAWAIAKDKEEIAYETIFVSQEPPTLSDIRRGIELAQQYGWAAAI